METRTALAAALIIALHAVPVRDGHAGNILTDALIRYGRLDYAAALPMLAKLAQDGDATAQITLASMYARGEGVARDDAIAFAWMKRAAMQGRAQALLELGLMYRDGRGTPANRDRARHWLSLAARNGMPDAATALGDMALQAQDHATAIVWFVHGARLGSAPAFHHLGVLHERGEGVPKDGIQAYAWHLLAVSSASDGDPAAFIASQLALRDRLTPLQIEAATGIADRLFACLQSSACTPLPHGLTATETAAGQVRRQAEAGRSGTSAGRSRD